MSIFISLVLPVLLTVAGGVVKKLVRGTGWKFKDFCFGVELAFTCVSSGIFLLIDIAKPVLSNQPMPANAAPELLKAGVFTGVSLFVFLVVMAIHQDNETDEHGNDLVPSKKQKIMLGLIANGAGIVTLFVFLLWVKGL